MDVSLGLRPYGWSPYRVREKNLLASAPGSAFSSWSDDNTRVLANSTSSSGKVALSNTSLISPSPKSRWSVRTVTDTVKKSSPALALRLPPTPSISAAI